MRSFAEARGYSVIDRCRNAEGAGAIYDVKELSLDFAFVTRLEVFLERCGAVWVKAVHHGKVMLDKVAAEIDSEFFAVALLSRVSPMNRSRSFPGCCIGPIGMSKYAPVRAIAEM